MIGGGGAEGDDPWAVGERELLEEAGLTATEWTPLALDLQLTNCHSTDRAYLYIARGLKQQAAKPDPTELLETKWVRVEEALQMVLRGEIRDSLSVIGILFLAR